MNKVIFLLLLATNCSAQNRSINYPEAHIDTVSDIYFGKKVADPYRWLENDTLPDTEKWLEEENDLSEKYLRKLAIKYIPERQLTLNSYVNFGTLNKTGKYYFDMKVPGYDMPASLYIKKTIDGFSDKIIDPADYKNDRADKAEIKGFNVSEDNKYIAFAISHNGSDWREIYVKTLYPFHKCDDFLEGVKFSPIEWYANGFFYLRYPQSKAPMKDKNENSSIWYHHLGEDQKKDVLVYQNLEFPEAGISFKKLRKGAYLIIYNDNMVNGRLIGKQVLAIPLHNNPTFIAADTIISTGQSASFDVIDVYNNKFLVTTRLDAPNGKFILFDKHKKNKAELFIPEYTENLHSAHVIGNKVVCTYLTDVDYITITYDSTGNPVNKIAFPVGCSVSGFDSEDDDSTTIFFHHSFLCPPVTYQYNVNDFSVSLVQKTKVAYDPDAFEIRKVYYTSRDGTSVPMFLAYKKGMKTNGKNPTILYGYGGYGITMTPFYDRGFMTFMQNGGIVALPCLRGGGEYGANWHNKGSGLNKQNVFDDFISAAEFLFKENYTSSKKLALMGGSNGGLLVAAVVNQRPDICKAVVANKGVYDMLRYEKFTIGHAWLKEFGSVKDSAEFGNLLKYSPLHNVREAAYPAMLIITADNDDRVVPLHSYKYTAALQGMNKGDKPVLLYVENNRGHTGHTLEADTYIYSFIYEQLKMPTNLHTLNY